MARADILVAQVVRLPHGLGLDLPTYQTEGAAAMDLQAAVPEGETVVIQPGDRRLIPTGVKVRVPEGYVGLVFARSGFALKAGLSMVNGVGVIDSDYTGEVCALVINHGQQPVGITRGLRVAQLAFLPVARVLWDEVGTLEATERGDNGFGSTGTK